MQKYGLLLVLANVLMKLFIGFGLWKMAMEKKLGNEIKSSLKYDEEAIAEGDPNFLHGQSNDYIQDQSQ